MFAERTPHAEFLGVGEGKLWSAADTRPKRRSSIVDVHHRADASAIARCVNDCENLFAEVCSLLRDFRFEQACL